VTQTACVETQESSSHPPTLLLERYETELQ